MNSSLRLFPRLLLTALTCLACLPAMAEDQMLHTFQAIELTDTYYSEGADAGDLNNDGHLDAVYGPYWFAAPEFQEKYEISPPTPQNMERYADKFFSWIYDFDGDGWNDVFVVGFPGTPAYVYQNPGADGHDSHWPKHEVFDWVSNESPQLIDLVGDERPELVCTRDGFFGFATINWEAPFETWTYHQISEKITAEKFGHGLGIGDVNGDGRQDIIHSKGWFEQPESNATHSRWRRHDVSFSKAYGGAEMYAYDVDGDGDNDIITSHAAHDFGLAWYEQVPADGEATFKHHLIMGSHPSENKYGVLFSELHSVNLADIDGDGLKDIVTGKTYFSHHRQSPLWDAGAVVYWFKLVRGNDGVDWIPYLAAEDTGIGRQVTVKDINGDDKPDIIVGGMKGGHVLLHQTQAVDQQTWLKAQPKLYDGERLPSVKDAEALRGPKPDINKSTGTVDGAQEGEQVSATASAGNVRPQPMGNFSGATWSGNSQLFWTGGTPGEVLQIPLEKKSGTYDLEIVLTCARDYAVVELLLNDERLGNPVDLYESGVVTTGALKYPNVQLTGTNDTLAIKIAGANPHAKQAYCVGLDYFRLTENE